MSGQGPTEPRAMVLNLCCNPLTHTSCPAATDAAARVPAQVGSAGAGPAAVWGRGGVGLCALEGLDAGVRWC